jgi:hypothetical protein
MHGERSIVLQKDPDYHSQAQRQLLTPFFVGKYNPSLDPKQIIHGNLTRPLESQVWGYVEVS